MKILALLQKPFDVLNVLEYCHAARIDRSRVTWVVIGAGRRQRNTTALLETLGHQAIHIWDPDLFATDAVSPLINGRPLHVRRAVQAILLIPSFVQWHLSLGMHLLQLRDHRDADLIVFDAWRAKLLPLLALNKAKHCVLDGGWSTIKYGLLDAFRRGGVPAVLQRSLEEQANVLRVPWIRRWIVERADPQGVFFSAYLESGDTAPGAQRNEYAFLRSELKAKSSHHSAIVLGFPGFKHALESCRYCIDWMQKNGDGTMPDVFYRPHPSDLPRRSDLDRLSIELRETLPAKVSIDVPEFGLELDLLRGESVPGFVFGYTSAARAVLGAGDCLTWVDLPYEF